MPTVTTTVTSAAACGTVTTQTTTAATPDASSGASTSAATTVVTDMLNDWEKGISGEDAAKYFSANCVINFGQDYKIKSTDIFKVYTGHAGIVEWFTNISANNTFESFTKAVSAESNDVAIAHFNMDISVDGKGRSGNTIMLGTYNVAGGVITSATFMLTDPTAWDNAYTDPAKVGLLGGTPEINLGEVVMTGFTFGEGPRFHNGKFYMVDFKGFEPGTHYSSTDGALGDHGFIWECDFTTTPVSKRRYACFLDCPPSGLGWLPDGRMLAVATTAQELRVETAPGSAIFVKHCDISSACVPGDFLNDMVVDSKGNAYVDIDFNFGNPEAYANMGRDMVLVTPQGELKVQPGSNLTMPNGAVITPDGKTYIVAETFGFTISAFDVAADGSLSNKREFADCKAQLHKHFPGKYPEDHAILPDGICLDSDGGLWVAAPGTKFDGVTPLIGGAVRFDAKGEMTHHFGLSDDTKGSGDAVMLDDEGNLYIVGFFGVGGHAPLGHDNGFVVKCKAPFPAAKSPTNPNYHAGYC